MNVAELVSIPVFRDAPYHVTGQEAMVFRQQVELLQVEVKPPRVLQLILFLFICLPSLDDRAPPHLALLHSSHKMKLQLRRDNPHRLEPIAHAELVQYPRGCLFSHDRATIEPNRLHLQKIHSPVFCKARGRL